jgi:hypothetical protein
VGGRDGRTFDLFVRDLMMPEMRGLPSGTRDDRRVAFLVRYGMSVDGAFNTVRTLLLE